jgi:uncharacterized coiled-coil DUF342 family protein
MSEKLIQKLFVLLICIMLMVGCKDSAQENSKTGAEAKKTNAELTRVKSALVKTQSESNDLYDRLSETLEEFEKIKSELTLTARIKDSLQNQIDGLTAQRDEAVTRAKDTQELANELSEQLKEKTEEAKALEELNEELLTTIEKLQEQLEQASGQITVEMYEEPDEQP